MSSLQRCVKLYIKLAFQFYYTDFKINGQCNIPRKGAVLFVSNHQNGLIDPLVIGVSNKRDTHFLARAAVFKRPIYATLLTRLQMLPIYRIRDGFDSILLNNEIFERCVLLLKNQKAILIFPEGNHNLQRRVRPLSKGFTRIVMEMLNRYPERELYIVPVGVNYDKPTQFPSKVSVNYGRPLLANEYLNLSPRDAVKLLRTDVHSALTKLTTHIPLTLEYDEVESLLLDGQVDFLNPEVVNETIISKNFRTYDRKGEVMKKTLFRKRLLLINTWLPYILWRWGIRPKISEPEFIDTFRFALGISVVPLFYVFQSIAIAWIWNSTAAII